MWKRSFVFSATLATGLILSILHVPMLLADQFNYPDFIDSSELNFVGSARVFGDKVRLTEEDRDVGALWHIRKQSVGDGFETTFEFQIGKGMDPWWCEHTCCGIAFVIQDAGETVLGGQEPNLAWSNPGYAEIPKSIAISFNTESRDNVHSIAVYTCGTEPNSGKCEISSIYLDTDDWVGDTEIHVAKIRYYNNTLSVFLENLYTPMLEVKLNLSDTLGLSDGFAWVGFTSSSRDVIYLAPPHDILSWSFQSEVVVVTRIIRLAGDLTFGNVIVGQTATRTLTIYNDGNSTLTVSGISYPNGFSGNWANGTIPAGGSQNVTVTFEPDVAQSYSGSITVTSDKTSGTNTQVCSGTGTTLHSDCPDFSGNNPVVQNFTFNEGVECECIGKEILTIGPNVSIKKGAKVTFEAHKIITKSEVKVEEGSTVNIKSN
jgi:hypothetical protein